jgi:hypothetical protein
MLLQEEKIFRRLKPLLSRLSFYGALKEVAEKLAVDAKCGHGG